MTPKKSDIKRLFGELRASTSILSAPTTTMGICTTIFITMQRPRTAPESFTTSSARKGVGYAKWATVYYLKQMTAALQYLQEDNLLVYEDLAAKAEAAKDCDTQKDMREVIAVKAKIGHLLGIIGRDKNKEMER
jgi:hypothetical protein